MVSLAMGDLAVLGLASPISYDRVQRAALSSLCPIGLEAMVPLLSNGFSPF
jgi:hypothetical protein